MNEHLRLWSSALGLAALLWPFIDRSRTDLHYAERDERLPEALRRVVVTVMGVVEDRSGRTLGVARIGLLASRLDAVARVGRTVR